MHDPYQPTASPNDQLGQIQKYAWCSVLNGWTKDTPEENEQ